MKRILLTTVALVLLVLNAKAATWNSATVSRADVATAIGLASSGDIVAVPAGSATYATTLSTTKAIRIVGAGTNLTFITSSMSTGGGDPAVMSVLAITTGNTNLAGVSGITFIGTVGGCGFYGNAPTLRIDHCLFNSFDFGVYTFGYGCIDHNDFLNCHPGVRNYASGDGAAEWASLYPNPPNSLNHMVVELNRFRWDNSYWRNGAGVVCLSSGQGSSIVFRFNTMLSSIDQFTPAVDWHGDAGDGTHGALDSQVYGNTFTLSGTASMDRLVDARGGRGFTCSNSVIGVGLSSANIIVREEFPADFPLDPEPHDLVNNFYVWQNTKNGALIPTFVGDSTGLISLGVKYFTNAPTTFSTVVFPHPLDLSDPVITVQPTNKTIFAGQSALFTVTATGSSTLSYQWQTNGVNAGTNGSALSLSGCPLAWNGMAVFVTVSDAAGAVSSTTAILTVNTDPTVVVPPQNVTVQIGQTATWTVSAVGVTTLHYQWGRNGTAVGTDSSSFSLSNCQLSDSGALITVSVIDTAGTVTSSPAAVLTVSGQALPTKHTFGTHGFGGGTH
jgi:hypothetical protein